MQSPFLTPWRTLKARSVGILAVLSLATQFAATGADTPPPVPRRISQAKTAYELWTEMTRSSMTFEPIEFQISPEAGAVSFGGEKEGDAHLLTRIAGPSAEDFEKIIGSLRADRRKQFLADLLNGLSRGRYQVKVAPVKLSGEIVPLPGLPPVKNYGMFDLANLQIVFKNWLAQTQDNPFSFLVEVAKFRIFDGEFAGMGDTDWIDRALRVYPRTYDPARATDPIPTHFRNWRPIFGEAEAHIARIVTELLGDWEINFKPKTTYGEYEGMKRWFRNTMQNEDGLYRSFGHEWLVVPKPRLHNSTARSIRRLKKSELYKLAQALIVLRGIKMQSGILTSMYNEVRDDKLLRSNEARRSILRLLELFPSNTGADADNIEKRSGTAYAPTGDLVTQAIISRTVANDWRGLADADSYILIPSEPEKIVYDLPGRFGVSPFEARQALARIGMISFEGDEEDIQGLRPNSLAPFWNWEQAPFVSPAKRAMLKQLTRSFIQQLAALPASPTEANQEKVLFEFARWSAVADLDTDIENVLRPKPLIQDPLPFGQVRLQPSPTLVDVNAIDIGWEHTVRFTLRASSKFTEEELKNGRRGFLRLEYDLTPGEKRAEILAIAKLLGQNLNGHAVEPKQVDAAGHGHSVAITYEIPDGQGRTWRVEWDGIGRDYTVRGNVLPGTERGGVVEVVSPKFLPTQNDADAEFKTFAAMGVNPSYSAGGGHISIDLKPFEGRPRVVARFIGTLLEIRDVFTAMFQHPIRFPTAEPHNVDQSFLTALENFSGSEVELKKFFYEARFFNDRVGRKTKYAQFEMTSYFQDVIPEELITADFDIRNSVWRRQFRVNPDVRKAEFRLFGAPRTVEEAHLQLKLVRAILNFAFNDTTPLSGQLAEVDLEKMLKDPRGSFARFAAVMEMLHLDAREYEGFYAQGLKTIQYWVDSDFYVPYAEKMLPFPHTGGWGEAVPARTVTEGIHSKGRPWNGHGVEDAAVALKKERDTAKRQLAYRRRKDLGLKKGEVLSQRWRTYNADTVAKLKRLSWIQLEDHPEAAMEFIYERFFLKEDYRSAFAKVNDLVAHLLEAAIDRPEAFNPIVRAMINDPRIPLDVDRILFYVLSMTSGKAAGDASTPIFARGTPDDIAKFLNLVEEKSAEFQAGLLESVELRRALYPKKGEHYETVWGDLLSRIFDQQRGTPGIRRVGLGLSTLIAKNDVSLGSREMALVRQVDAELKRNPKLPEEVEENRLGRMLYRRCSLLAAPLAK